MFVICEVTDNCINRTYLRDSIQESVKIALYLIKENGGGEPSYDEVEGNMGYAWDHQGPISGEIHICISVLHDARFGKSYEE